MAEEKCYEEKAAELLKKLERPREKKTPQRPYFIEITGSPSAGKSTMIDILDPFFRRQGFRVYTPQEGAEAIRHIDRNSHLYNVRTGLYALINLIDLAIISNFDLVIFDRCLHDAYAWMEDWHNQKDLSRESKDILQKFFMFETWLNWIDAVFFVVTTPEEAVKRDREVSLTSKFGKTTNPDTIKEKVKLVAETYYKLRQSCPKRNLFFLDTTGFNRQEMTDWILEKALGAMEKRFGGKR